MSHLETLSIDNQRVQSIYVLSTFSRLTNLSVESCSFPGRVPPSSDNSDPSLNDLPPPEFDILGLTNLRKLHATGTHWEGYPDTCWGTQLGTLTNLEVLNLANTRIGDEEVATLTSLIGLRTLDISRTLATNKAIPILATLTSLENVGVKGIGDWAICLRLVNKLPKANVTL
jgi:hypothetical protein